MKKWNEEAAPNNNLTVETLQTSKLVNKSNEVPFAEELSDDGERNKNISNQIIRR